MGIFCQKRLQIEEGAFYSMSKILRPRQMMIIPASGIRARQQDHFQYARHNKNNTIQSLEDLSRFKDIRVEEKAISWQSRYRTRKVSYPAPDGGQHSVRHTGLRNAKTIES
jgi:hypothetical protein